MFQVSQRRLASGPSKDETPDESIYHLDGVSGAPDGWATYGALPLWKVADSMALSNQQQKGRAPAMKQEENLDAAIREFVAHQMHPALVAQWVDYLVPAVLEQMPAVAADDYLVEIVRASAESQWTAFLGSLTQPEQQAPMMPLAADMAIAIARRGHQLKDLFLTYRLARRGVWNHLKGQQDASLANNDAMALLIFVWDRASHWIDEVVEASAALFEAERDQLRQGAAAQRYETVRQVIDGQWTSGARRLSEALDGHPISCYNTALVLTASDIDKVADLDTVARDLARAGGIRNPLLVSPGGRDIWVWLGGIKQSELEKLLVAKPDLTARGISVAVGTPGEQVDGFRRSHLEALQAQQLAAASSTLPNPLSFPEVEVLVFLWQSGDQAVRFVRRTLGGLNDTNEAASRLRQTVRATLHAGSIESAAETLNIHKNTVRYRMNQAEKILGREVNKGSSSLVLALDYHHAFLEDGADHPLPS